MLLWTQVLENILLKSAVFLQKHFEEINKFICNDIRLPAKIQLVYCRTAVFCYISTSTLNLLCTVKTLSVMFCKIIKTEP